MLTSKLKSLKSPIRKNVKCAFHCYHMLCFSKLNCTKISTPNLDFSQMEFSDEKKSSGKI